VQACDIRPENRRAPKERADFFRPMAASIATSIQPQKGRIEIVKFTCFRFVRGQAPVVVAGLTLLPGIISDTLTPFMVVERVTRQAGTR
jgi:hypothetical protein